jgi:hypothetical protein
MFLHTGEPAQTISLVTNTYYVGVQTWFILAMRTSGEKAEKERLRDSG